MTNSSVSGSDSPDKLTKHSIAVVGSMMIDLTVITKHLPRRGETVFGEAFSMVSGGKGSNQAAMAARMGVPTWMVGNVGDDVFQHVVFDSLNRFGVHTDDVKILAGVSTGVAHIRVDASGDNDIVIVPNANTQTNPAQVDAFLSHHQDIGVMLLQLEIPLETVVHAAKAAHAHGITVVLNPAPAVVLPADIFQYIDLVNPNETEAGVLTGIEVVDLATAEEAANRLCSMGAKRVIITLGGNGVLYAGPEGTKHYPAFEVEVVDTTAAGDAFTGALGAGLAAGLSWPKAIVQGLAAGSRTVTKLGAQSALPGGDEVRTLAGTRED